MENEERKRTYISKIETKTVVKRKSCKKQQMKFNLQNLKKRKTKRLLPVITMLIPHLRSIKLKRSANRKLNLFQGKVEVRKRRGLRNKVKLQHLICLLQFKKLILAMINVLKKTSSNQFLILLRNVYP